MTNVGGGYEIIHTTTTRTGSWDIAALSTTDVTQNTTEPPWTGWNTTMDEDRQQMGYGVPYDPSAATGEEDFQALGFPASWTGPRNLPISVTSGLVNATPSPGTTITHPFDNPSTAYPYFTADPELGNLYRVPDGQVGEINLLTDFETKIEVPSGGNLMEWSASKMEVRMVRPSGSHLSSPLSLTVPKARTVDGVTTTTDVTFTIPAGATVSASESLYAYASPSGTAATALPISMKEQLGEAEAPRIEGSFVDRDDATAPWSNPKDLLNDKPLYSGKGTGDMVWFYCHRQASNNDHMDWKALGPNNILIQGPIGNKDWKIFEGGAEIGEPTDLRWKPGTYTVSCTLVQEGKAPITLTREVKVGFRTDDFVVVGQVVPTDAHSIPGSRELTINFDLIADVTILRNLVIVIQSIVNFPISSIIAATPPALYVQAWALYYSYIDRSAPMLQSLNPLEKAWLIQTLLNISPDEQRLANDGDLVMGEQQLTQRFMASGEYRIYTRFLAKGLIGNDGSIQEPQRGRAHLKIGRTKLCAGLAKGQLWDFHFFGVRHLSPRMAPRFTTEPAEEHVEYNGTHQNATSYALYGGGRIGEKGRKVQWRLFGKDAPWIFAEIQFNSNGAGEFPDWKIYTSVDKTVTPGADREPASDTGDLPFNNLSVFKRDLEDDLKRYKRIKIMRMEGHVKAFVESSPEGAWNWRGLPPHTN